MGSLTYDNVSVEFDDRALIHVQIVIVQKLRHGDSFLMSWRDSIDVGSGRSSIWLHPSIPLYFKFFGGRVPAINRAWLSELARSADSSAGLIITSEPVIDANSPHPTSTGEHPSREHGSVRHTTADLTPARTGR